MSFHRDVKCHFTKWSKFLHPVLTCSPAHLLLQVVKDLAEIDKLRPSVADIQVPWGYNGQ